MNRARSLFSEIIGWIVLVLIITSVFLISIFESWSLFFTALLVIELVLVIIFINSFTKLQITISRIILGCLFIFSGFVKGVDPVGMQYRIEDYFIAFGTEWAIPYALPLSVILNAIEFVLGILLLLNINIRITAWLVLIMMSFFTVLTLNDALNNPVPDCGCFGDAFVISNWQTFYKNISIDAMLIMVFLTRKRIPGWFNYRVEWTMLGFTIISFVYFEIYNIRHLPVIDFLDWKVGKKMVNENPVPLKYYLTYRNKQTGENREYLSPNYPYNDSAWLADWQFVGQRIIDPNPHLHDLHIEDEEGIDRTANIIGNPDYQFILISYDLSKANLKNLERIRELVNHCDQKGISIVLLTSSLPLEATIFTKSHSLATDIYYADDVLLMAMIRSNPGLILMKNGVVLGKWHYHDIPTIDKLKLGYPSVEN